MANDRTPTIREIIEIVKRFADDGGTASDAEQQEVIEHVKRWRPSNPFQLGNSDLDGPDKI